MLVSLIIPAYNSERYISDAIDSVLKQPFKDIEIIIINDGSTDGSGRICQEYAEKYENIKYFEQSNNGASSARNKGMEVANGKYIMFLDSDDRWVPNSFDTQMEQLLKGDFDVIMC